MCILICLFLKEEAISRSITNGRNIISPVSRQDSLKKFFKQCLNTFRMFLLIAAVACFIIYGLDPKRTLELGLAVFLLIVYITLSIVSYWQENKAFKVRNFAKLEENISFCSLRAVICHSNVQILWYYNEINNIFKASTWISINDSNNMCCYSIK